MQKLCRLGSFSAILALAFTVPAQAGEIDNGVPDEVGYFTVDVDDAGDSYDASIIDEFGSWVSLLNEYRTYVIVDGESRPLDLTTDVSVDDDNAESEGSFVTDMDVWIYWAAVSTIPFGGDTMSTVFTFWAEDDYGDPTTFGDLQLVRYLDADVDDGSDDWFEAFGSVAGGDIELFTLEEEDGGLGIGQGSGKLVNAELTGAFTSEYFDLIDAIEFDDPLDPFDDLTAWGPGDVTSALLWTFHSDAEVATITSTLRGTPEFVPLPPAAWIGLALLGTLGLARRLRRRS